MVIIPKDYAHGLDALQDEKLTIICGGTDVMVKTRNWSGLSPKLSENVLNISGLEEMEYIYEDEKGLHIGAGTKLEDLLKAPAVFAPLKAAIKEMASPAIRHVGTIGGNIGNASPAGDTLPILYAYDTCIVLESVEGIRELSIFEFITGPGQTARNSNEIIKEIILNDMDYTGFYYEKVGPRRSDAISKLSFIGMYKEDENGVITDVRIAFGAVYKTIVRNIILEQELIQAINDEKLSKETLVGKSNIVESISGHPTQMVFDKFAELIQPIDDQRSNAKYRKSCALSLLKSFIKMVGGK